MQLEQTDIVSVYLMFLVVEFFNSDQSYSEVRKFREKYIRLSNSECWNILTRFVICYFSSHVQCPRIFRVWNTRCQGNETCNELEKLPSSASIYRSVTQYLYFSLCLKVKNMIFFFIRASTL